MKNKPVIVEQVFVDLKLLLSTVDMILGGIRMLSFQDFISISVCAEGMGVCI